MPRLWRAVLYDLDIFVTVALLAVMLAIPQGSFAWGREGHQTIVIVAEHYMRPETAARMRQLLAPESPEEASGWADEYRHVPALTASPCGGRRRQRGSFSRVGIVEAEGLAAPQAGSPQHRIKGPKGRVTYDQPVFFSLSVP
jgi:hypothetical protein